MQSELAQLSGAVRAPLNAKIAVPHHLFYPTDAAGLAVAIRTRSLRAPDWRTGCGPVAHYGTDLVEKFLDQRWRTEADPLRAEFRNACSANFSPRGTHFDAFVTRLFACPNAGEPAAFPGYALGLSVASLSHDVGERSSGQVMHLTSAIYAHDQQNAIIKSVYQAYEDYYVGSVRRFGARHRNDLLTPCWDKFRYDIGSVLMRFRDPTLAKEGEWIAIALSGAQREDDTIAFDIIENRFVPAVALDIGERFADGRRTCALGLVVLGPSLPFASTRDGLRAFLGCHGAGSARILPTEAVLGSELLST